MNISEQKKPKNFKYSDNFFHNHVSFSESYFDFNKIPVDKDSIEIAILGRSNVGKSTLINNLCMNKNLAFTSKKPGCTVSINFYRIDQKIEKSNKTELFLVDLPGYGYARKGGQDIKKISSLINNYLIKRQQLIKVYLLIDSRVGIQSSDAEFINFFHQNNLKYQIILTKIDKAKKTDLDNLDILLKSFFQSLDLAENEILKVSAKEKINLDLLRNSMMHDLLDESKI
jgi:GTP-binding protein